jgi:hypothetical protein
MRTQLKENIKKITEKINCREDCDKCPLYNLPFPCGAPCTDDDVESSLTKIYSGCKDFIKMVEAYKEPVLDEVEKKYLTNILRPFVKNYDITITKETDNYLGKEYLVIKLHVGTVCTDAIELPYFKPNTMYKGMTSHRVYTLKNLGLKF